MPPHLARSQTVRQHGVENRKKEFAPEVCCPGGHCGNELRRNVHCVRQGNRAFERNTLANLGRDKSPDILTDRKLEAELGGEKYPLVLANIVADVIIPLSARAGDFLTEDGVFLCSGIIDTRADEVAAALEKNGLHVFDRREQNGWVALAARK